MPRNHSFGANAYAGAKELAIASTSRCIDQGTVTLLDTPLIQQFEMDFSFFKDDEVTLVPISFYNGSKYDDICISEIQSSLSKITHPSINQKYKVQELLKKGSALKKGNE